MLVSAAALWENTGHVLCIPRIFKYRSVWAHQSSQAAEWFTTDKKNNGAISLPCTEHWLINQVITPFNPITRLLVWKEKEQHRLRGKSTLML